MSCRFQQLRTVADDAGYTIEELLGLIPKLTAVGAETEHYKRKLKAVSNKADMYKKQAAERDAQLRQLKSGAADDSEDEGSSDDEDSLPFDSSHLLDGMVPPAHLCLVQSIQPKGMTEAAISVCEITGLCMWLARSGPSCVCEAWFAWYGMRRS